MECNSQLVLLNCEEYKWLSPPNHRSAYDKKPDMIVCHPGLYEGKPPSAASPAAESRRTDACKFGIIPRKCLHDSISCLFEATVKIGCSDKTFGEVINYGRLMASTIDKPAFGRVVLYDKNDFWLFLFRSGVLINVKTSPWMAGGSRALLKEFLSHKSRWIVALETLCHLLAVEVNSFLGYGAFGRGFRVRRLSGDQADMALKIVLNNKETDTEELVWECDYLRRAREVAPDLVPAVANDVIFTEHSAGLLLEKVGCNTTDVINYGVRVCDALVDLHKHRIVHGDPRLSNAIVIERGVVNWIDFRWARFDEQSTTRFSADMRELLLSFFEGVGVLPDVVASGLNGYNPLSDKSIEVLREALVASGLRP